MFGTVVFTNRPKVPEVTDRGSVLYHAMRKAGMRVPRFLQPYSKAELQRLPAHYKLHLSRRLDPKSGRMERGITIDAGRPRGYTIDPPSQHQQTTTNASDDSTCSGAFSTERSAAGPAQVKVHPERP